MYSFTEIVFAIVFSFYSYFLIKRFLKLIKIKDIYRYAISFVIALVVFYFIKNIWSIEAVVLQNFLMSAFCIDIIFVPINFIIKTIITKKEIKGKNIKQTNAYKYIEPLPLKLVNILWKSMLLAIIACVFILYKTNQNGINYVYKSTYNLITNKVEAEKKILYIADVYYGKDVQNKEIFLNRLRSIDIDDYMAIIFGGDIISSDATFDDIKKLRDVLGQIVKDRPRKIFYVYGDEEEKIVANKKKKKIRKEDLDMLISSNGITYLDDMYEMLEDSISFFGRKNFSKDRMPLSEVLKDPIDDRYCIIIDHNPCDAESASKLGIRLQLSGFTHAGQCFPNNLIYSMSGLNNYGMVKVDNMNLIVTSGFSPYKYPFRNIEQNEFVVINIKKGTNPEDDVVVTTEALSESGQGEASIENTEDTIKDPAGEVIDETAEETIEEAATRQPMTAPIGIQNEAVRQ